MPTKDFAQDAETIISASVKVEGDFVSEGNVLIVGSVEGSLRTQKDLCVGERAKIAANVTAANAVIAGEIKGNVSISGSLELESTANILGDVTTSILVVASGAMINGKIAMAGATIERPVTQKRERARTIAAAVVESEPIATPEPVIARIRDEATSAKQSEPAPTQSEEKEKVFNPFFMN